jgi:hypothetical protein
VTHIAREVEKLRVRRSGAQVLAEQAGRRCNEKRAGAEAEQPIVEGYPARRDGCEYRHRHPRPPVLVAKAWREQEVESDGDEHERYGTAQHAGIDPLHGDKCQAPREPPHKAPPAT